MPTGRDLVASLAARLATLRGEDAGSDPIGWYRRGSGGDPDYSKLLEALASSPEDRQNLLREYFEPSDEDRDEGRKIPSAAHRAVAGLVAKGFVSVIVTTNFDRLMEQALRDAGVDAAVIASSAAAEGAMPLAHSGATVIKVHGDYPSPDLKNTVEELGIYDPAIVRLLGEVFDQYGLVICGWSATWDNALRDALERIKSRRFTSYWLYRNPLEEEARRLIVHRRAIGVAITDADTALGTLEANVEALAEAADQRPQTTDLAVARLKKFLPDPVHRIRLHDLLAGETQAAVSQIESLEAQPIQDPQDGQQQIDSRAGAYETATATLLRLLIVGGRFSDREEHDRLWAECVSGLANSEKLRSGEMREIAMQFYPTLLALYAVALGSAVADRIHPIAHTLTTVTMSPPPRSQTVPGQVSVVVAMDIVDEAMFPASAGRNRATRLSEHLLGVLRPAAADVIPRSGRLEDLFDEAEYLLGLACTAQSESESFYIMCPASRAIRRQPGDRRLPGSLVARHERTLIAHRVFRDAGHLSETRDAYNRNMQEHRDQFSPYRPGG